MVVVFVWASRIKDNVWGHASVQVGQTYMSWWPEPENRQSKTQANKFGIRPVKEAKRNIYTAGPFRNRTYDDDVAGEEGLDPSDCIRLDGLNEVAMKDWWQSFGLVRDGVLYQGPLLPWETLTLNCSTVAASALSMGGGEDFAPWYRSNSVVWTPNDVLKYAKAIRDGLSKKK